MVRVIRPTSPIPAPGPIPIPAPAPGLILSSGFGGLSRPRGRGMRVTAIACPPVSVMMIRHSVPGSPEATWARLRAWKAVMGPMRPR